MTPLFSQLRRAVEAGHPAAVITVVGGPQQGGKLLLVEPEPDLLQIDGTLGDAALDAAAAEQARDLLRTQASARVQIDEHDLFIDLYLPPRQLFIIGAVHTAIPLVTFAKSLGFHTTVLDARGVFATPERFGHADELIVGWPADALAECALGPTSYVVALTHDPKIDNPALLLALDSPVRYVGALGSRRTHAARCEALRALGASDAQLARIHAPIGLDLGGRRPEEIALAIMAEIVAVEHNRRDRLGR